MEEAASSLGRNEEQISFGGDGKAVLSRESRLSTSTVCQFV
jgi:hypothetical protein